jgi:uncharacterized protein YjbI with pentapeptide repeats
MDKGHAEILAKGAESWNAWRQENPGIHPDLSGVDLSEDDASGYNFSETNLCEADLYQADLKGTNLKLADLRGADLSAAKLIGADLYKCDFTGAFLTEADLSGAYAGSACFCGTDLRGASFVGANLTEADFRDANLMSARFRDADLTRGDLTGSDLRHTDFADALLVEMRYGNSRTMRGKYFGIRGLESTSGNALFVRDATDQDYLDTLEHRIAGMPSGFGRFVKKKFFGAWGLIDFGRSLVAPAIYAAGLILLFGVVFALDMSLDWGLFDYEGTARSWLTPFYFSVVTYTTLGYGDVTPTNLMGEILVVVEVLLGYTTLGLILSILANKVARRS